VKFRKIKLNQKIKQPILALGVQSKSRICFAYGSYAYLGAVHTDLGNPRDLSNFNRSVRYFIKKNPVIIAYDLHPEYTSTKHALTLADQYRLAPVQHHHAHIASCMLENGVRNQEVIGVAFDGTGLGDNNTFWGGEFLICDYRSYRRMAHLKEIPLLGGEQAIREPWRLAAAWLYLIYKDKFFALDVGLVKRIKKANWRVLKNMYSSGFNSPLASSAGRLFDAAASLALARTKIGFEAELARELEALAARFKKQAPGYNFGIIRNKEGYIIDPCLLFKGIISDLKKGEAKTKIAYRFHLSVAEMIKEACLVLRQQAGVNKVVLSGGVFQNNLLRGLVLGLLYKERFRVFGHRRLLFNDSNISLGQVAVANARS